MIWLVTDDEDERIVTESYTRMGTILLEVM